MQFLRGPLTAVMCLTLVAPPLPSYGQAPASPATPIDAPSTTLSKSRTAYQSGQLRGDERILHALNRFTFGPRPGDLEVLRQIGLDNWFEQQLHPADLDLSDLNARLSQFPAMQWSTQDILFRLPSNALIRQAINGQIKPPDGGALHAIWENQIARVTVRQQEKKEANAQAAAPATTNTNSMNGPPSGAGQAVPQENAATAATGPATTASDTGQMNMAAPESAADPMFGEAKINALLAALPAQRVARLATMQQPEFDAFVKELRPVQRIELETGLNPDQREVIGALENPERLVAEELVAQRLTRDIYSTAQVQEVMTDFWLNHFNVYLRKNETMPYELVSYERDVIRPRALGKFEDLLESVAHSPAMLMYLDNAESIGPDSIAAERAQVAAARRPGNQKKVREGLNENYARELMELHTVGVNGGYTQADVTQVARILTGWTIQQPQRGGGFEFNPNRHEPGSKKALGQKFKENGEAEGRELLHFLATRPATAQFISRKIAIRFVSDDPPQPLVDRMAKTYMTSGGDISAVLRTLYHSPEFWSTTVYHAKVKTPIEYVVSAVRASDANVDNLMPLVNALRTMGMPLYGCVPPTGYNWKASEWVSTGALVDRMNFALALAANRFPGIAVAWTPQPENPQALIAPPPAAGDLPTPQAEESRLETMIVAGGVSPSTRDAVLQQFQQQIAQVSANASAQPISATSQPPKRPQNQNISALDRQDQLLAGLLIGSPEFQRR